MLFSGIPFLFYFLPAVLLVYAAVPRTWKNAVLLCAGLLFYAWGEQRLVLLFALSIFLGWATGLCIERFCGSRWADVFLALSVLQNLGFLFWFKYADFALSSVNALFSLSIPLPGIALPIGISFYTFQILSYTVDVWRGSVKAQRSLVDFGVYVSFFPQLIAGPIVRYADMESALHARRHTWEQTARGVRRFLVGLCKKVLFANVFGEAVALFRASQDPSVLFHWLYALSYMLQVYFDFSGYSDMAIGLGRLFGFELPENFDYPYISRSITEFWRRWHITLGRWFRDYVYIPLGGNRKGLARQIFNILTVWMLTGLWHGAAWNFVLWGLYFAVFLIAEKVFLLRFLDRHPVFGHGYVLLTVLLGFVLFNAEGAAQTLADFKGLFGLSGAAFADAESLYYVRSFAPTLLLGALCATPLVGRAAKALASTGIGGRVRTLLAPVGTAVLFLVPVAYLVDGSFNPFLYFRF